MRQDGQQTTRIGMWIERAFVLSSVHASVNRMQDAISASGFGEIEERPAKKPLARFAECQADRIVHPASDDPFQLAAVRPSSINMCRP